MSRRRVFPLGTPVKTRVAASTAALVSAGGARKTYRLSPAAHDALKMLMQQPDAPGTQTELIEQLLLAEKDRREARSTK